MPVDSGTVVANRYRITRPLGKGGMGEVHAAENMRTGRHVALKLLRAEAKSKQSAIERFRREARAAGSINSDFVTQVLDVEDDPEHGIVLVFELLEGESLVERLKRTGPIPYDELWGIAEAVWMGLADAHAAGIVHRDLKPSNVFLEQRRNGTRVKILDFGISKLPKKISHESLTQVGQSLGTFSFMPPEQIGKAKSVDHRADIYACATLIYQSLSGKLPYHAKNVVRMMELKSRSEPRTLGEVMRDPVDARLEAFIAKGLSRNPDHRFQTAVEALEAWRQLRPPGARSQTDMDASGAYPHAAHQIEDPPSSGDDVKTRVMRDRRLVEQARRQAAEARAARQAAKAKGLNKTIPMDDANPVLQTNPDPSSSTAPTPQIGTLRAPEPAPPQPSSNPGAIAPTPISSEQSPPAPLAPPPEATSSERSVLALILGAVGLMLVGFVAVAVVLHFIR